VTVRFKCDKCGRKLKADKQYSGSKIPCPRCGTTVVVPHEDTRPPSAKARRQLPPEPSEEEVRFGTERAKDEGLDMTPMVDVTFLLLIFFMVTAAYSLQKSIEVPPPDQEESSTQARTREEIEQDDDYIIVHVARDNTIWVNDVEAPSEQELLAKLREFRDAPMEGSARGPSSLMVMADGEAMHEKVILALDAGNAVGMENVRLATVDDDDF
jgi:biopolymer transport protein ExbD